MADDAIRLTATDLAEHRKLDAERRELDRKSRTISARLRSLEDRFLRYLQSAGKTVARRKGFEAAIEQVPGRPSWKDEFVARLGAAAADEVAAAVPARDKVVVREREL